MHGNLAVEEKRSQQQHEEAVDNRKVVYRASRLPIQEKLLYLFVVLICVVVAGVVIWRYAQIYQMNTKIHNIERSIIQLEAENSALKEKITKMMDPALYIEEAAQAGLVPIVDQNFVRVPAEARSAGEGLAMNP